MSIWGGDLKNLLGIDIGGTKCAITLGRFGEKTSQGVEIAIQDKVKFPTEMQKG